MGIFKEYIIRVEDLGDTCVGTEKNFVADYNCGLYSEPKETSASKQAHNKKVIFSCP